MEEMLQRIADVLDSHSHTKTAGSYHTVSYDGDNIILVHGDCGRLICLTATDLTERPEAPSTSEPATRMVEFVGEAWVRDWAVAVDDATVSYGITEAEYLDAGGDDAADYDALKDAARAPQWVKDWFGPFTITPSEPDA